MNRIKLLKLFAIAAFAAAALFANVYSNSTVAAADGSEPALGSGALIFANNCARCHGDDGEGDKGPAINTPAKQKKFRANPQALIRKISNGGGKMPAFRTRLTPAEIRSVANFVKTL